LGEKKNFVAVLKVTDEIAGSGVGPGSTNPDMIEVQNLRTGSEPKCHGSATLMIIRKIDAEIESIEKKKFQKIVTGRKLLHTVIKVKNLRTLFFSHFLLITFFACVFCNFCKGFKFGIRFCVF
jgi:hypothetical protein